jgi:hypothetical protein
MDVNVQVYLLDYLPLGLSLNKRLVEPKSWSCWQARAFVAAEKRTPGICSLSVTCQLRYSAI